MKAIDLYSGIGGWTLGLKMAGIDVIKSYEWWSDANTTHNKNFGLNHPTFDIRKLDVEAVPAADIVVGSPPCTQFSFSNRGGNGNIQDGIVDLFAFLEVVENLQPKYWAMENVPRVAGILEKLVSKGGYLHRFSYLFKDIQVLNSADFGVPQSRERMIAGNFPFDLLNSYKSKTERLTLGNVVSGLEGDYYCDPIYNIRIHKGNVTDHLIEDKLSTEEERINRESKSFHPVYNMMNFPDKLDRPARTVTAVCTRVSRESIVIQDSKNNYRRLSIRERGMTQSFPITYQFHSKSYGGKMKMIGNAIPPLLTFYIGQSMREVSVDNLILPEEGIKKVFLSAEKASEIQPEIAGRKFKPTRSFWLAIPNLRFGSGMRFDLKNSFDKSFGEVKWKVNFFYGSSKDQKELSLDHNLFKRLTNLFNRISSEGIRGQCSSFLADIGEIERDKIQQSWLTGAYNDKHHPFNLVDRMGEIAFAIMNESFCPEDEMAIRRFVEETFERKDDLNTKISLNGKKIFAGFVVGSLFNRVILFKKKGLGVELIAA